MVPLTLSSQFASGPSDSADGPKGLAVFSMSTVANVVRTFGTVRFHCRLSLRERRDAFAERKATSVFGTGISRHADFEFPYLESCVSDSDLVKTQCLASTKLIPDPAMIPTHASISG